MTLEGNIIHKSGLITGGQTSETGGRRWEEREIQGLQKQQTECMAELKELQKQKREIVSDDELVAKINRLEAEVSTLKNNLNGTSTRLTGIQDEIKNIDKQLKEIRPKLRASQGELEKLRERMSSLEIVVNREEDRVFAQFCQRIGVANIREYEERQVKLMQQQSDARLQFDSQLARLTHQANFDKQQIQSTRDRLDTLKKTVAKEQQRIRELKAAKRGKQDEIDGILEEIKELEERLGELNEEYNGKKAILEEARAELNRISRGLDGIIKEIASRNDEIEKLGSERNGIYRRCRLEEIELPLIRGSLNKVPLEEARDVGAPM